MAGRLGQTKDVVVHALIIGFLSTSLILPNTLLNIDRSRSFYVLSWIDSGKVIYGEHGLQFNVDSPEASDLAGVSKRVKEQISRGLIYEKDLTLTKEGKILLATANFLSKIFVLENWTQNKE